MFLCAFARLVVLAGRAREGSTADLQSQYLCQGWEGQAGASSAACLAFHAGPRPLCCKEAEGPLEACPSTSTHLIAALLVPGAARVTVSGPRTFLASLLASQREVPAILGAGRVSTCCVEPGACAA